MVVAGTASVGDAEDRGQSATVATPDTRTRTNAAPPSTHHSVRRDRGGALDGGRAGQIGAGAGTEGAEGGTEAGGVQAGREDGGGGPAGSGADGRVGQIGAGGSGRSGRGPCAGRPGSVLIVVLPRSPRRTVRRQYGDHR